MTPESLTEDLLRRVFRAAPVGLVVLDPHLDIIDATDAYLRQTMTTREDIIGRYAFEVFPDNPEDESPTSTAAMRDSYLRVLATGRPDSMALQRYDLPRREAPDGAFETRYWSVLNTPVLADDGSIIAIIHRADDVTAVVDHSDLGGERPSDWSYLTSAAILQRSVEMQEANRALLQADFAKNDFLSRMSHELRTPLNAIIGFAQLLGMGDLSEDEQDSTAQILRAGRHLLELINDVLDLSGVESGRVRFSLEGVELPPVFGEVVDLLRAAAAARGISLSAASVPPVTVLADRQRLKQVLLNLVSNAVKYNRQGGRVDFLVEASEGSVEIGVRDDGPGISPEHQARLFTPFDRLGAEQSEVEGTGLGLALSQTLVEAVGGAIRVDSTVGSGTTFWVRLASTSAEPEDAPDASEGDGAPGFVEAPGTILYVEDNIANTTLMERVVARFSSLRLITAVQGSLAVELAQSQQPGLILLDLNLPDISGEVVLARLRAEPLTRGIPVVVVSADASPRQAERLRELGAAAYLTKPFDLAELIEVIGSYLGQPQ